MAERDTTAFIPLNKFRAIVTTLNGVEQIIYQTPDGVSTIGLSIQFTNTGNTIEPISVFIKPGVKQIAPNFDGLDNEGEFNDTADLIQLNLDFIVEEVKNYIINFNITNPPIIAINPERIAKDIRSLVTAIINDLRRGDFINSTLAIKRFYNNYGVRIIPQIQLGRFIESLTYTDTIIQSIINNQTVSPLYQSELTQSFDFTLIDSGSGSDVVTDVINVATSSLVSPIFIDAPKVVLSNSFPIPSNDSLNPVVAGKIILEEGYSLIASGSSNISVVLSLLESANE
jgi:hypothetical protein